MKLRFHRQQASPGGRVCCMRWTLALTRRSCLLAGMYLCQRQQNMAHRQLCILRAGALPSLCSWRILPDTATAYRIPPPSPPCIALQYVDVCAGVDDVSVTLTVWQHELLL